MWRSAAPVLVGVAIARSSADFGESVWTRDGGADRVGRPQLVMLYPDRQVGPKLQNDGASVGLRP